MGERYKINDEFDKRFFRVPSVFFIGDRYKELSNESRLLYGLFLDRLFLSKRNKWTDENGYVYIIYTRKEAGDILGISEKKATKIFKELKNFGLIEEQKSGRGFPNLIFPLKPDAIVDTSDLPVENGEICESIPDDILVLEPSNLPASNTYNRNKEFIINSFVNRRTGGREKELEQIIFNCDLYNFEDRTAEMLENSISILYYCESFKTKNAVLPRTVIRRLLRMVDYDVLIRVVEKLRNNTKKIKNTREYIFSVILDCVDEEKREEILLLEPKMIDFDDIYLG